MRMEEAVPLWGRRTQKKRSWKQGVCVEGSLAFPLAPAPDPAPRGERRDAGWGMEAEWGRGGDPT